VLHSVQTGSTASATWGILGTFVLGSDWANAGTSFSAYETWSLTQTGGAGHSISVSGSFASPSTFIPPPPPSQVPEPLTLSLFGAGLAGLGALRMRKKKSA
jgi:hypothetical protein